MRLLLIRHGQTPANVRGELDTAAPGPGLTRLGERQSRALVPAFSDETIDAIYASTLVRTQLTATPLSSATRLDIEVRRRLREVEAGDLERRSDPASVRRYLETVFAWGAGDLDARIPGGPDGNDFFGRYDADIAAIENAGVETAAVVSHGAAIRVWAARHARNIAPSYAAEHPLDNTGVVVLDGSMEYGWTLTSWAGLPVAGPQLADVTADDPTGETLGEARADTGTTRAER